MEVLRGLMEDLNGLMRISCLKVKLVKPPRPLFLAFDWSKSCSGLASRISWLKHSLISDHIGALPDGTKFMLGHETRTSRDGVVYTLGEFIE